MSLDITSISASLGGVQILKGITLRVPEDGITGLIGPNGAGKSTLFAVISGFLVQTEGEIRLGHHSLEGRGPAERAGCGMVRTFQVPREFRHMTVRENLYVAAPRQPGEHLINLLVRRAAVEAREREVRGEAEAILAFLRLDRVANTPAGQLSGGQKKLLELGRVMMLRPRLVLLDEPFAGVNAVLIAEIMDRIRELHGRGIGFLIIEHDLEALSGLACVMHVLDRGSLLASGPPRVVLANPLVRDAYLGGSAP
jgi:branched-chain amino acid transport system ATP-binding protein